MRNVRFHPEPVQSPTKDRGRFNVLLTEDRLRGPEHWSHQLPRLMEPMGVHSYRACCGEEALEVASRVPIHAAVVDVSIPRVAPAASPQAEPAPTPQGLSGGLWLLELFRRMPQHPPVIIVHSRTITSRDVQRLLHEALRLGAFTVLENNVGLEQMLGVFRRMLDRLYQGLWPEPPTGKSPDDVK